MGSGCITGPMKLCRGVKGSAGARRCGAGENYVESKFGVSLLSRRFSLLCAYVFDSLELRVVPEWTAEVVFCVAGRIISGCHMCYGMALKGINGMGMSVFMTTGRNSGRNAEWGLTDRTCLASLSILDPASCLV